jgi:histidine ammonia-lyase
MRAVCQGKSVALHQAAAGRMNKARTWIENIVSAGADAPVKYEMNTGFRV